MLSIAALVTSWRNRYPSDQLGVDDASIGYPDPKWCLGLNGASLACGCFGNIFLLLNFTRRVRYIVALPMTIILWYFATGIVSFLNLWLVSRTSVKTLVLECPRGTSFVPRFAPA